jgi:DNA-binding transcriptional LysR family regulator
MGVSRHETWEVGGVKCKIEPILVVNDLEVACDAAVDGVGVARLPSLVCRDAVRDGRLQLLFGDEPALLRPLGKLVLYSYRHTKLTSSCHGAKRRYRAAPQRWSSQRWRLLPRGDSAPGPS